MRHAAWGLVLVAAALALPAGARAGTADDDLAVVKKAVASAQAPAAAPAEVAPRPAEAPAARPAAGTQTSPRKGQPQWLRVRIVEKGAKKATVKVNLPLALVRSVGEDWPLECGQGPGKGHVTTLGEVLRALDSGQELVEIEDDGATVRVWVE